MGNNKTPWYMHYQSSNKLSNEDRLFLNNYTECEVSDFILKYYPNIFNESKLTVKDAVDFMRWCMEY